MKLACALFIGVMCYLVLGCGAALSEKECINADWRMIGLEDGMRGKSMLSLSGYRKACSEVDVVPDLAAYEQGHNDGLKHYCVYQTGYNLGQRGSALNTACPETAMQYQDGYAFGRRVYDARVVVNTINRDISASENRIETIKTDIASNEHTLVAKDTDAETRLEAVLALKKLNEQLASEEGVLRKLQRQLTRAQRNYQSVVSQP